jgi:hypothetical protein
MFPKIAFYLFGQHRGWVAVLFAWCLATDPALAQKYEFGLGLGTGNYKGDLAQNFHLGNSRLGIQGFFRFNPNPRYSLRANLLWVGLRARDSIIYHDPFQYARNLGFRGNVRELAATFEYNFFNFRGNRLKRGEKFCPFFFAGVAVTNFSGRNNYLPEDNNRYGDTQLAIPFGVGVKTKVAPKLNLTLEFGARKLFADNLDGIVNVPEDPKFRKTNPNTNDMYYFAGLSLSYVVVGVRCPESFRD